MMKYMNMQRSIDIIWNESYDKLVGVERSDLIRTLGM